MADPLILIYDDRCGFCRGSVAKIVRRSLPGAIRFVGCESEERQQVAPQVPTEECLKAMTILRPDGLVLSGVDAAPDVLSRMRGWRFLAPLLRFAPLRALLRPLYAFVADHRQRDACEIG